MPVDVKISALPAVATVAAASYIPCVVGGVTSRVPFGQAANLFTSGFLSDVSNPALAPATGLIRVSDTVVNTPVIVGLSSGADYNALQYNSLTANWIFGVTAQYSTLYGFAVTLQGATGIFSYDQRSGITSDLTYVSICLAADKPTSLTTGNPTNLTFAIAAGETWEVDVDFNCSCGGIGGVKFSFDCPVGATLDGQIDGANANAGTWSSESMIARNTAYGTLNTAGDTAKRIGRIRAVIDNPTNAGSVTLRIHSATAAQVSTIYAKAKMHAQRVTKV